MISFLCSNDKSIQDRLLPVIYKSLDFNQSEMKRQIIKTRKFFNNIMTNAITLQKI